MSNIKLIVEVDEETVKKGFDGPLTDEERQSLLRAFGNAKQLDADRPQGEWICITEGNLGINTYTCSLCGHLITCTEGAMKQHKGCYCGAVMKGGAE